MQLSRECVPVGSVLVRSYDSFLSREMSEEHLPYDYPQSLDTVKPTFSLWRVINVAFVLVISLPELVMMAL